MSLYTKATKILVLWVCCGRSGLHGALNKRPNQIPLIWPLVATVSLASSPCISVGRPIMLVAEWEKVPVAGLQNLVETLKPNEWRLFPWHLFVNRDWVSSIGLSSAHIGQKYLDCLSANGLFSTHVTMVLPREQSTTAKQQNVLTDEDKWLCIELHGSETAFYRTQLDLFSAKQMVDTHGWKQR